jgi:hypothetical protein
VVVVGVLAVVVVVVLGAGILGRVRERIWEKR